VFPAAGTILVTQVVLHGTNAYTGEAMRRVVDVGGTVGGLPSGLVLGSSPLSVTIPALRPMHGEVRTTVNYDFYPTAGPPPIAGISHTQILGFKAGFPPAETEADPEPAFFINYGYPQAVIVGPGKITGADAKNFTIVALKHVPAGTRDCQPSGAELFEQYTGSPAQPPSGTECGIEVKFTPDEKAQEHPHPYRATLQAEFRDAQGGPANEIPVSLIGCDERNEEKGIEGFNCAGTSMPQELKEPEPPPPPPPFEEPEEVEEPVPPPKPEPPPPPNEEPTGDTAPGGGGYVDPSGTVLVKTEHGPVPLPGATVTLEQGFESGGPLYTVPNGSVVMSPANRLNPDKTRSTGEFGWDVLGGIYAVTASREGCASQTTPMFTVPPPVTELALTLTCTTPPTLSPTTTSVSSSTPTSIHGEAVTFTATVAGSSGPSGTVTFKDSSTTIGSAVVQGGKAAITLASLSTGTHTITAAYNGDGANEPSASTAFSQSVIAGPLSPEFGRCEKVAKGAGKFKTATCTTTSSGGSYEWKPGVEKRKFVTSASSTVTLESIGKTKVVCHGEGSTGEYSGTAGVKAVVITLTECASGATKCTTKGHPEGDVVTTALEGLLGVEAHGSSASKDKLGLDLFAAGKGVIAEFGCGSLTARLRGSVITPIKSDKMAATAALKFAASKGTQKTEAFEGQPKDILEASFSEGPFEQAGLKLSAVQTNEEAVEANAVV
jgi:hypothetical protein